MDTDVQVKAIRLASTRLASLKSERDELAEKISQLNEELDSQKKIAKAQDLAMRLVLDEDTRREIGDKTAQIKDQDMNVVEKAMALDLLKKEASIGISTADAPDSTGSSGGDDIMSAMQRWASKRSEGGK